MVDEYLSLLERELKCHKLVREVLRERLLHEEHLIIDIGKQISEYDNKNNDIKKHIS